MFVLPHIFIHLIFYLNKMDYPNVYRTALVEEATDGAAFMCPIQNYSPILPKVQFTAHVPHASLWGLTSYLVVWFFSPPAPSRYSFPVLPVNLQLMLSVFSRQFTLKKTLLG